MYLACDVFVTMFKEEKIAEVDALLERGQAEGTKLKAELNKRADYEKEKTEMEGYERAIRIKLDTIYALVNDRSTPPKLLLTIANAIPKDIWLSELIIKDQELSLKGTSIGFNLISDFMRSLGETAYFKDVTLKGTEQSSEQASDESKSFELQVKRR
jgi:Tfp pilus assembly protein PilN